jgi:hypothetical protein
MNSCRDFLSVVPLVLLIVISGCGSGGDQFNANAVTVSVAPPSATVAAGGQATLQATVSGCGSSCPSPALTWSIAELQTNGASGAQCNWQNTTPPPGPCPDGTIEGADTAPFQAVTFHAPSNSGTIHVVAQWTNLSNPPTTKTGTAVITVP